MSGLAEQCLASWRKHLPDYELRLWNEDSFDPNGVPYAKEAYEARKFAFVADYVRLFAISKFGGVYMDTDVEVVRSLDGFLKYPAFSGFESETAVSTCIMASEKAGMWATEQLAYYRDRHFRLADGTLDLTTNVRIITSGMAQKGLKLNNTYQIYDSCMHVFPKDVFSPMTYTGRLQVTDRTHCIHHFAGGWESPKVRAKMFLLRKILGPDFTEHLILLKRKVLRRGS